MEITKEQLGDLNAVVRIKVSPSDYSEKVDQQVRKIQRNANVPGFRPGKVPVGMVKKMYGKGIVAEELNKLLNDSLYNYLSENKIEILGNPLPKDEVMEDLDFENPKELEFAYELGLSPNIDLNLSKLPAFQMPVIAVDEEMMDRYITDVRRRYGKFSNPEVAEEIDILYGDFEELNADGSAKEGGAKSTTTLAIELIKDASEKAKFVGLKKDDSVVFNPKKALENETELAAMLRIEKSQVAEISDNFKFTVKSVNRIEKAELNTELFDKIYGEGTVQTEAEFQAAVKSDIQRMYRNDSERKLQGDMRTQILEKISINLPDEFLKRWILTANEKPVSNEELENEYPEYAKGLKWRLIENMVIKSNDLQVTSEEVKDYIRSMMQMQFAQYGQQNVEPEVMEKMVENYLKQEEQTRRAVENIASSKVFDFLKGIFTIEEKEIPLEEFTKAVNA